MKKNNLYWFTVSVVVMIIISNCTSQNEIKPKLNTENIVLAYVTSWSSTIPDPTFITHINYAFGHVNEYFNGVRIDNEERLRSIVQLKKDKPSLKVMLSIGGWGSGRFSEMAQDETRRKAFASDCGRVVEIFELDGIDLDWEYPTSSAADISSSPNDTDHFTLLIRDLRKAIGKEKLLTFASAANARYVDFKAVNKYIDFVNIMTYDIATPPFHHAPLYKSPLVKQLSVSEAVEAHIREGIAPEKLTIGIPFYGRGSGEIPNFIDYKEIIELENYQPLWDEKAKVPYLADSAGNLVCSFETTKSISIKCAFLKEKGLLGAMYWDYNGDDIDGSLRKAVYDGVMIP